MQHDELRIELGGAEDTELYKDLLVLEVELDEQLAGAFRLSLRLEFGDSDTWKYLDDERLQIWQPVIITAGLEDDVVELIDGYITHVRPEFGPDLEQCRLEIWGQDASVLMDREDKLKAWPNKKDSDIATETFREHGLTPEVTDTDVIHDEEVSTIVQRETDIQFLKRLALRNGFECFVQGRTGYFRPPPVDSPPQPVLNVHGVEETNVDRFSLEVNALAPANVAMFQFDHVSGQVLSATAESAAQPALGAKRSTDFLGPRMAPGLVYIGQTATTGQTEMDALCQGLYDQGEWFVTGEGEVAANEYGSVLMPRGTVTIRGIGNTHSGVYYVTHVTHRFAKDDGYRQVFRVKRNGLMPTGDEDFTGGGGGLLGGLL